MGDLFDDLARRFRAGRGVLVLGPRVGGRPLADVVAALHGDAEPALRSLAATRPLVAASLAKQRQGGGLSARLRDAAAGPAPGEAMRRLLALPYQVLVLPRWDDVAVTEPLRQLTPADGEARRAGRRDRCVFRMFGALDRPETLLLGETDVARALAQQELALLADLWLTHTFLFVGFAAADVELTVILERALAGTIGHRLHYALLAEATSAERDVLHAAHGVVSLPCASPLELADALEERLARLPHVEAAEDEARDRMALRRRGQHERVAELVLARVEAEPDAERRREELLYLVDMYEHELEQPDKALATLMIAHEQLPREGDWERLSRLAGEAGEWAELLEYRSERASAELEAPRRARAWREIGELARAHGDETRAAAAFRAAIAADPAQRVASLALEQILRERGDWVELARLLEARVEHAADDERRVLLRELAALQGDRLGDRRRAIRWLEELRADRPDDAATLRELDRFYGEEGAFRAQLDVLGALVELLDGPAKSAVYRRMAATCEERLGIADEAIEHLERLHVHDPHDGEAVRNLVRLYAASGAWRATVDLLGSHAAALPPGDRGALHLEIARILERQLGDSAGAARHYREAADRLAEPLPALRALARVCEALGDPDALFEVQLRLAAREKEPAARAAWRQLAAELAMAHRGDSRRAEELLGKALEEHPGHVRSLALLAELRERAGERAAAVALLAEAVGQARATERPALLRRLAELREALGDRDGAIAALRAAVALEPVAADLEGLERLLAAAGRDEEREAVLDQLVRLPADPQVAQARLLSLARLEHYLGHHDAAASHYDRALATEPDHVDANRARAELFIGRQAWAEARARLARLSAAPGLAPADVVKVASQLALCALRLGDREGASRELARGLTIDPTHRPSLLLKLELADSSPAARMEARRAFLSGATPDERFRLWIEIGDLALNGLDDPVEALAAYRAAEQLRLDDRGVARKILEVHLQQKQWRDATRALEKLVELETDPRVRARYRTSWALIVADELGDEATSLAQLEAALVDDPTHARAAERLERALGAAERWPALAAAHLAVLKRLGPAAADGKNAERLRRWTALVGLSRDHLGKLDDAVVAMEVALELAPDAAGGPRALVELYLKAGPRYLERALAVVDRLLAEDHGDREAWRQLARLCREAGRFGRARAAEGAAAVLEGGDAEAAGRPAGRARPLDETAWRMLAPAELDLAMSALFLTLAPNIVAHAARPLRQLGLDPRDRVDLEASGGIAPVLRYVLEALGLSGIECYRHADQGVPVRIAALMTAPRARPVLLLGADLTGESMPVAGRIFEVARSAAHLVGGSLVRWMVPRADPLAQLVDGVIALAAGGDGPAARARAGLGEAVNPAQLEQITQLGERLRARGLGGAAAVTRWLRAAERITARAAYVLSGDLGACARRIEADPADAFLLPTRERLLDLIWASAREETLAVRRRFAGEEDRSAVA